MKKQFDKSIYNVVMPRCRYCRYYANGYDIDGKLIHFCYAAFNRGDYLIYQDTLDQCDTQDGFKK